MAKHPSTEQTNLTDLVRSHADAVVAADSTDRPLTRRERRGAPTVPQQRAGKVEPTPRQGKLPPQRQYSTRRRG